MKGKIFLTTFLVVLFCKVFAQDYIKVIKPLADIRFDPATSADLVAQAKNGNVFEIRDEKADWYGILMFTGEYRYIQKSDCEKTGVTIQLTANEQQKKIVFIALRNAEDRAQAYADEKYPTDIMKNITYFRTLLDKYNLEIMNKYEFQAPTYRRLVMEGVKKEW